MKNKIGFSVVGIGVLLLIFGVFSFTSQSFEIFDNPETMGKVLLFEENVESTDIFDAETGSCDTNLNLVTENGRTYLEGISSCSSDTKSVMSIPKKKYDFITFDYRNFRKSSHVWFVSETGDRIAPFMYRDNQYENELKCNFERVKTHPVANSVFAEHKIYFDWEENKYEFYVDDKMVCERPFFEGENVSGVDSIIVRSTEWGDGLWGLDNIQAGIFNTAPSIDVVNFEPKTENWTEGQSPNITVQASDSTGSIEEVKATVTQNKTGVVHRNLVKDGDVWKKNNLFNLTKPENYSIQVSAFDDYGMSTSQTVVADAEPKLDGGITGQITSQGGILSFAGLVFIIGGIAIFGM